MTREGIKYDPKKVQSIMDLGRPTTTNEARMLICMVQYYRDMLPMQSQLLAPLTEAFSRTEGWKIPWNDALEDPLKELKRMVSSETLFSYPDWTIPFTVHTDASEKHLGAAISHNNKPITFFSIILSKPQSKYTMTQKEVPKIVECLKQFCGIIFGYEINVFSDNKNLVYSKTLSESQRMMCWQLIIE